MKEYLDLHIGGMQCTSCEKIISGDLSSLAGAKVIVISAKKGRGVIEIENNLISKEQVIECIGNSGYSAKLVEKADKKKGFRLWR